MESLHLSFIKWQLDDSTVTVSIKDLFTCLKIQSVNVHQSKAQEILSH